MKDFANTDAITTEIAQTNNILTRNSSAMFGGASEQAAQDSGYIDTPKETIAQEIVRKYAHLTEQELELQIRTQAAIVAQDTMALALENAAAWGNIGLVELAAKVQGIKADASAEIALLNDEKKHRANEARALQSELGAAFTEQVLLAPINELLSVLSLSDVLDLSATVEVSSKSGKVSSVKIADAISAGKVLMLQVSKEGKLSVTQGLARIGTQAKTTTDKAASQAHAIRIDYVPAQYADVFSVGQTFASAKEAYLRLEQTGKIPVIAKQTTAGTERSFSGSEYLRKYNVAFSKVS